VSSGLPISFGNGSLIGGLRERVVPADKDLEELVGLHIDGLKKKCTGAFKTEIGREETVAGSSSGRSRSSVRLKAAEGEKSHAVVAAFCLPDARAALCYLYA